MNVASQEVLQCSFHAGLKPVIFYVVILFAVASIVLPFLYSQFPRYSIVPIDVTSNQPEPTPTRSDKSELENLSLGSKADGVAANNLPHLSGPFVGRKPELQEITDLLINSNHSGVTSIGIYGMPGIGKSTLAIHIGYEIAKFGIEVRHINVRDTHLFREESVDNKPADSDINKSDKAKKSSCAVGKFLGNIHWYDPLQKKFISSSALGLVEWAKGLEKNTLLILDNCEQLLWDETQKEPFEDMIWKLHEASPLLCILLTSQQQLALLNGFKSYHLQPLDDDSAIDLLEQVSYSGNIILSTEEGKEIAELVGNHPLALKIVGCLKTIPVKSLIVELKQNIMKPLSPGILPKGRTLFHVFNLSYTFLDKSSHLCAQYINLFPGSFDQNAVHEVLNMCWFHSPEGCVKTLEERSLLDCYSYSGQVRYQLHSTIRNFLSYVQLEEGVDSLQIATKFGESFQHFYVHLLSDSVAQYNSDLPNDEEMLGRFEYESHNYMALTNMLITQPQLSTVSLVSISRNIVSRLLLEIFTRVELLRTLQTVLHLFDENLEDVARNISLDETLDIYMKLVLQYKEYIFTAFPNTSSYYCYNSCDETFGKLKLLHLETLNNTAIPFLPKQNIRYLFWVCYYNCNDILLLIVVGLYLLVSLTLSLWEFLSLRLSILVSTCLTSLLLYFSWATIKWLFFVLRYSNPNAYFTALLLLSIFSVLLTKCIKGRGIMTIRNLLVQFTVFFLLLLILILFKAPPYYHAKFKDLLVLMIAVIVNFLLLLLLILLLLLRYDN